MYPLNATASPAASSSGTVSTVPASRSAGLRAADLVLDEPTEVRAGGDVQAAVLGGHVGERGEDGDVVRRFQAAVAVVLVQRDVALAARRPRQFDDELVVGQCDVRAEQPLDRVEVAALAAEPAHGGRQVLDLLGDDEAGRRAERPGIAEASLGGDEAVAFFVVDHRAERQVALTAVARDLGWSDVDHQRPPFERAAFAVKQAAAALPERTAPSTHGWTSQSPAKTSGGACVNERILVW